MALRRTIYFASTLLFAVAVNAQKPAIHTNGIEFTPNKGQIADTKGNLRPDILYTASAGNAQVYLRAQGLSYVVSKLPRKHKSTGTEYVPDSRILTRCRIDMDFIGASVPATQVSEPTDGYLNFYLPQCPNGVTGVKSFNKVLYKGIYQNIDIDFGGNNGLEYNIVVNPGGNPDEIKMHYTGAKKIEVVDGKLRIITAIGDITESIPSIYQMIDGKKVQATGGYKIEVEENSGDVIIGLKIKKYNRSIPLIIDPWWSTYLGGNLGDDAYGTAFDNAGNLFISGTSESNNFPTTAGVFQSVYAGGTDAYAFKFTPKGARIWGTYYGGSGEDDGRSIAVDSADYTYMDGITSSSNFPVTPGALQSTLMATGFASYNAFLVRLTNTGTRVFGTYYGGNGTTQSYGVTIDSADNGIMVGYTNSTNIAASVGAFETTNPSAAYAAFCAKFSPTGTQLWGTYIGGSSDNRAFGVAVDQSNNVFVGGSTTSSNFPVTPGCYQSTFGGGGGWGDAFIFKFTPTGAQSWATYLGGSQDDGAHGVAIDGNNNVIATGMSLSPNYPVTPGAYQTTNTMITKTPIARADFLTKMTNSGSMVWSTYYNVATEEGAMSIDVDDYNRIYIVDDMETSSTTPLVPSPVTGCTFINSFNTTPDPSGNPEDQFISKFSPNGFPICETFVGGKGEDDHEQWTKYMSVKNCQMAICGFTDGGYPVSSGAFQTKMPNPYQTSFITDLSIFQCGDTVSTLNFKDSAKGGGCSTTLSFYSSICDTADTLGVTFQWSFPGGTPSSATGQKVIGVSYATSGTYPVTVKIIGNCQFGTIDSITKNITATAGFSSTISSTNPATCGATGNATVTPSGTGPFTYAWSNGNTNQKDTGLTAGTYTCIVSSGACKDTLKCTITNPTFTVSISATKDSICSGSTTTLTASGGTSYSWNTGATSSNIIVNPTANTTYSVTIKDGSCQKDTTINIAVTPMPSPTISSAQSICTGGSVKLTAGGGTTYAWTPATGLSCSNCPNPNANPTATTIYTVTISNGACSVKDSVKVTVNTATATGSACCDTTINFGGTAQLNGSNALSYSWSPATGLSCTNCPNPTADPSVTTAYIVTLTDTNGCLVKDTVVVTVLPENCGKIFVPNAFSPNGDGENDILYVYGGCILTLDFKVFDRWGNKVFETEDQKQGWDGVYNGILMNTGVFFYYLQAVKIDGSKVTLKGNVNLIR